MKKKILSVLVLLIMAFSFIGVNAASAPSFGGANDGSFTLSMTSTLKTVKEGSSVIFRVSAKEIDIRQGITTLNFELDYSKDIIEPIVQKNINLLADTATIKSFDEKTGRISIAATKFITADTPIFQVEAKPKEGTTGKQIVMTLKNIKGSNGSTTANAVEISSTVEIGTENVANQMTNELDKLKKPDPIPMPQTVKPKEEEKKEEPKIELPKEEPKKEDDTTADKNHADAGIEDAIVPTLIALAALALLFTYRYVGVTNAKIKPLNKSLNLNKDDEFKIDIK